MIHVIVVNVECEMVLYVGQVPMFASVPVFFVFILTYAYQGSFCMSTYIQRNLQYCDCLVLLQLCSML